MAYTGKTWGVEEFPFSGGCNEYTIFYPKKLLKIFPTKLSVYSGGIGEGYHVTNLLFASRKSNIWKGHWYDISLRWFFMIKLVRKSRFHAGSAKCRASIFPWEHKYPKVGGQRIWQPGKLRPFKICLNYFTSGTLRCLSIRKSSDK